ncbi:MAG: family 16 glycoside hydrolase, partial [Promethearchaeota archaeon]
MSILLIGLISSVFLNINNIENDNFNYTYDDNREDYFSKIQLSAPSDKNWWDSSYKYRIPINITNNHISNLPKGYSVNISINTTKLISTGKLRSDGKDLRIVWYNSTSTTWLELDRINGTNFDTADTQIWFKTQASINPSADDTSYHLYYGNENANDPPTDRSKIYDFYDDFTQSDGPAAGWTVTQGTGWSVITNRYRENEAATDRRTILNTYTVENATIEVRIMHLGGGATFGGGVMFRYSDGNNFYTSGPGFWGDEVATGRWTGGAPAQLDGTVTTESVLSTNIWYDLRIEMLGNQYDVYLNDSLKNSVTNSDHLNAGQIGFMTWTNNLNVYFDDLKVGLLVATPPILIVGTEEVYGSWYNKDWNYHKKITVTSSSATIPAGYTVSLTFNHESLVSAGRSRVDGDDIRVVYWNGSNWRELDRMLDSDSSWNSSSTKIWFRTQA